MTRPKVTEFQREHELFRNELINLVDQRHGLVKLAGNIDWDAAAERFGALYAESKGRPGVPARLMVGLHYLKHAVNLSNELVVAITKNLEEPWITGEAPLRRAHAARFTWSSTVDKTVDAYRIAQAGFPAKRTLIVSTLSAPPSTALLHRSTPPADSAVAPHDAVR